jgi:hypothetical protein
MNRKRHRDKFNAGKSKQVPYRHGEAWHERHNRRKKVALMQRSTVEEWCGKNKFTIRINNQGHHWIILNPNNKSIQWWPSSGKLVIGSFWNQGVHVHDIYQLIDILGKCKEDTV